MALTVNKTRVKPLPGAVVRTIVLGEAASAGQVVTPNANGLFVLADANAANLWRGVAVIVNDGSTGNTSGDYASGESVSAVFFGPIAGIDGMDPTLSVWVSTTAGGLTQTRPSGGGVFPSPMGHPIAADVLWLSPQPAETTY